MIKKKHWDKPVVLFRKHLKQIKQIGSANIHGDHTQVNQLKGDQ